MIQTQINFYAIIFCVIDLVPHTTCTFRKGFFSYFSLTKNGVTTVWLAIQDELPRSKFRLPLYFLQFKELEDIKIAV